MIHTSEIKMAGIKARKALKKYPELKDNIDDAWDLMCDEIEQGESEDLEVERFISYLSEITEGEL